MPGSTAAGGVRTVPGMMVHEHTSRWAWLTVVAAAVLALALLFQAPAELALVAGPLLALGLMGVGMLAAAVSGRLWLGIGLALLAGLGLTGLARGLGLAGLPHPLSTGLAMAVASLSFAARGTLFARAYPGRGWWIAVFVVGGEAAMLMTASLLPGWVLALLPAQWASTAIQTAVTGTGTRAAASALLALGGTAVTTLVVAQLLPRRWPYALMFTAWLALSALVLQRPAPPVPHGDLVPAATAWLQQRLADQ